MRPMPGLLHFSFFSASVLYSRRVIALKGVAPSCALFYLRLLFQTGARLRICEPNS